MNKIKPFANIYTDETYVDFKADFLKNPNDRHFVRESKEAFKCTFASDIARLIEKVSFSPKITYVPSYIYEALKQSKYPEAAKVLKCIFSYCENKEVWKEYCGSLRTLPDKLKFNANHKFGMYFNKIYADTKNELKSYITDNTKEQIREYKFALLIVRLIVRTFYFSALPLYLNKEIYNMCIKINGSFDEYYHFDRTSKQYKRRKYQKRGARSFGEDVAWLLVYNNIVRYGFNK